MAAASVHRECVCMNAGEVWGGGQGTGRRGMAQQEHGPGVDI